MSVFLGSYPFSVNKQQSSSKFETSTLISFQILQFNAHEVHEVLRGSSKSLKPSKNVPIALAIYPTASLINHR